MSKESKDIEWISAAMHGGREPSAEAIGEAANSFDPSYPAQLIDLLTSPDPRFLEVGLQIFAELDERGLAVVDAVLHAAPRVPQSSRFEILIALVELARKLTAEQIALCLPFAEDDHAGIRRYMCLLLSEVDGNALADAVSLQDDMSRKTVHASALRVLQPPLPLEQVVDLIGSGNRVESCYAGAALIKLNIDAEQRSKVQIALGRSDLGQALLNHLPLKRPIK